MGGTTIMIMSSAATTRTIIDDYSFKILQTWLDDVIVGASYSRGDRSGRGDFVLLGTLFNKRLMLLLLLLLLITNLIIDHILISVSVCLCILKIAVVDYLLE